MEDSASPYLLKSPTVLLAVLLLCGHSTGLECGWAMTSDKKIIPLINPSGVEIRNATTLEQCQSVCVNRSEFLCHSINYNHESQTCVLSAENLQTANQTAEIGWMSGERPACQGVWLPWTATRGMKLSGYYHINGTTIDSSATENCTTRCHRYQDCRSVTLRVQGGECELWTKREGDEGVMLEENDAWQSFNAPLWYLDDSIAATGTKEHVQNRGAGRSSIQMFVYLTVPVDGYLIGWKYFNVRGGGDDCISYADIWRTTTEGDKSCWQLISLTRLEPENFTNGIRFQYVAELVHVRAQDFVGTHVDFSQIRMDTGQAIGCSGNRVSFGMTGVQTPVVDSRKLINSSILSLTTGQQINTTGGHIYSRQFRTPAMKAYILPYANFTSVEIQHTDMKIQISWEVEDQKETLPLAGYRLSCNTQSDFTSNTACPTPASLITSKDVTFIPPTSTQIVYTRVQAIRNINGREEADLTYSQTSIFCSAHPRTEVRIKMSNVGRIAAGETTTVSLETNGLQNDDCASRIIFLISPSSDASQINTTALVNKSQPVTAELDLNIEYNVKLRIELADSYEIDGRMEIHKTPDAPSSPKDFSVSESLRNQTSIRVTWSSVHYGLCNITSYQVRCHVKNSTFNLKPPTSPAINMTVSQPLNELDITGLRPQVQYTCTVRANIEQGYGYNSSALKFWTKPTELTATWSNTSVVPTVEKNTVVIALPSKKTEQAGAKYRYLQIKVETTQRARRASESNNIKAELDLYIFNFSNFTVGEGQAYGGYLNEPLSPGVYAISVGYRAETESRASGFDVIPGGENLTITTPVPDTINRDGLTAGGGPTIPIINIVAGIGAVVLLTVIIIIAVVILKRRNVPSRKNTDGQDLTISTDVLADTEPDIELELDNTYERISDEPEPLREIMSAPATYEHLTARPPSSHEYAQPGRSNASTRGVYENTESGAFPHLYEN